MEVACAGDDQSQVGGEPAKPGARLRRVVGMVHLKATETRPRHGCDHIRADGRTARARVRVGQHADTARLANQPYCIQGVGFVLAHPVAAASADPGGCERGLEGVHESGVDERLGHMRASDHTVGLGGHLFPAHGVAIGGQLFHHSAGAGDPVVA